jgi:DNA-binding CsgD family transcriptional regulator
MRPQSAAALARVLARLSDEPLAAEDGSFRDELLCAVVDALGGSFARVACELHALARRRAGRVDEVLRPRESEVLAWVARGLTIKAVAARLSISPRTAEAHRARLMLKLGARTQIALLGHALARGLVELETT